jgi:hypothetical protein
MILFDDAFLEFQGCSKVNMDIEYMYLYFSLILYDEGHYMAHACSPSVLWKISLFECQSQIQMRSLKLPVHIDDTGSKIHLSSTALPAPPIANPKSI